MDLGDYISIAGIISTIAIAIFVQRATSKAANAAVETVRLTEASINLSKSIADMQLNESNERKKALRHQYVEILWKKARLIKGAVGKTTGREINYYLKEFEFQHNISPENLAIAFEEREIKVIHNAWTVMKEYMEQYFKAEGYPGDSANLLITNADKPLEEFEIVVDLLERIRFERTSNSNNL